jgi:hypothetical protein
MANAATASRTERTPVSYEAATMVGVGVSPAARASANGSPPGRMRAIVRAELGRLRGSGSRHFRRTFGQQRLQRTGGEFEVLVSRTTPTMLTSVFCFLGLFHAAEPDVLTIILAENGVQQASKKASDGPPRSGLPCSSRA